MPNSITAGSTAKRQKHHRHEAAEKDDGDDGGLQLHRQCLIPGIPDHIAQLCLSPVSPSLLHSVCRSWRRLIYAPSFPPFLSLYALLLPMGSKTTDSNFAQFSSFDPISCMWNSLPPPPELRFIFQHPSFISRKLSVQSVAVSGKLVIVAGTNDQFLPALPRPLVFNPASKEWSFGPSLSAPRRWCAAGVFRETVYVASGIGAHYSNDVARSVEKWNLIDNQLRTHEFQRRYRWIWEKMGNLKDGKFSREAIDAVGWRGKLCMVNVKGDAAKEGIIYDVESDEWEEMPEGMLSGWRGPAAAMNEETMYIVDESKGLLRKYDHAIDMWEDVVENDVLKGAQHVAAAGGKVCVVRGDCGSIVVVDVAAMRLWEVDVPDQFQVLAVHILPRLSG